MNTWVNLEYPIHVKAMGRTQEIYAWHVRIFNQYYRSSMSWYQYCLQQQDGIPSSTNSIEHIDSHFGTKGSLQCNMYKLLIFNEIKSFMKLHNECTITKFTFLLDRHDIITFNIVNYIIHISNSSTKQL